ncbi:MAG: carbon-nitrogen hydrolase family protein [Bacteroidales bacterium]|nr:carbon-nitrogen hydrolase family protein [Bacteroidales bacterium]
MKAKTKIRVAVVQATPVIFNLDETFEKTVDLIHACKKQKAGLILFPESFIPAYPRGLNFGAIVGKRTDEGRRLWQRYSDNSVEVPGPVTDLIGQAAKNAQAFIAIGVTEKDKISGTLYCTLLYFSPSGKLIGKHRKLKPTGTERVIWGEGDGSTLITFDTGIVKIGGLICWENYMPEARLSLYKKGVQIYLAPTADARESWQSTLKHIAMEGRCFVLGCNQFVKKSDYPADLIPLLPDEPEVMSKGGSVILSPLGKIIEGPVWGEEKILFTDIDLDEITRAKMDFDVIGHYARPDVFNFEVPDQPETIIVK